MTKIVRKNGVINKKCAQNSTSKSNKGASKESTSISKRWTNLTYQVLDDNRGAWEKLAKE